MIGSTAPLGSRGRPTLTRCLCLALALTACACNGKTKQGDDATEGDDATQSGDTMQPGDDTAATGFALEGCGLEPSCARIPDGCDFDFCSNDYASPEHDCVFEALASSWSGPTARIDLVSSAADADTTALYAVVIALGNGRARIEPGYSATLLSEDVVECELQPAPWFQACVGNDMDDDCYMVFNFFVDGSCEPVEAPVCEGL